jgi:hypothetical protein
LGTVTLSCHVLIYLLRIANALKQHEQTLAHRGRSRW